MNQPHHKQCKRYDIPGDAHFITFSCYQRLPLLSKDRSREWMIDAIQRAQEKKMFDLWAYVIMPEHVHLVLFPINDSKISSILKTIKQSVSRCAIVWMKKHAPDYLSTLEVTKPNGEIAYHFWQRGGGYDRNLRSVRDIHEKVRYVHDNPVQRGLCEQPVDWYWSSAKSWVEGTNKPLELQRDSLPPLTNLDDDVSSCLVDGNV